MLDVTNRIYPPGENGTLKAVCRVYSAALYHEGCPFQKVCCAENWPVNQLATLRILNSVDAETLEMMAKAIRLTKEYLAL